MIPNNPDDENLVAEFCDSEFAAQSRGFLIQRAAQVVYIARMCKSTRLTAAFLSKKYNRKFSRSPVEDILKKVRLKQIVVTPEQLAAAARQHPRSEHFAEMCPEVLDPNSKMEIGDTPTPTAKKAAATKREAKKSGNAENTISTPKKSDEMQKNAIVAPKPSTGTPVRVNPKEPESVERNELLEAVDAELGPAGVLID